MRKPFHLRPSEIRFLKLIAGGYSHQEAAEILGITPNTASSHADHIHEQTNLSKLEVAAILAMRMGYFTLDDVQFKFKDPAILPWSSYPRQPKP